MGVLESPGFFVSKILGTLNCLLDVRVGQTGIQPTDMNVWFVAWIGCAVSTEMHSSRL